MTEASLDEPISFESLDLYKVLQLDISSIPQSDITPAAIKKAYRVLALKVHPDKARNEKQKAEFHNKFQQVSFAYSILSDPVRKKQYDRDGSLNQQADLFDDEGNINFEIFADFLQTEVFREEKSSEEHKEQLIAEIERLKKEYTPEQEYEDLIKWYNEYKGDFRKVFDSVMFISQETDEDFMRLVGLLQNAIDEGEVKKYKKFDDWEAVREKLFLPEEPDEEPETPEEDKKRGKRGKHAKKTENVKPSRKPRRGREAVRIEKEQARAAKRLGKETAGKPKKNDKDHGSSLSGLEALIAKRRQPNSFNIISSIESKYNGNPNLKRMQADMKLFDELSEEDFLKLQPRGRDSESAPENNKRRKRSKNWLKLDDGLSFFFLKVQISNLKIKIFFYIY